MALDVNWSKCIICQDTNFIEPLKCPKNSRSWTDADILKVYTGFLLNVKILRDADIKLGTEMKLPKHITAQSLYDNDAKWHKQCRLKFSDSKVETILKLHEIMKKTDEVQPAKRPRQSEFDNTKCIFCQKASVEMLHNVLTFEFGSIRKEMAHEMNDVIMTLRLDKGDLIAAGAMYHQTCNTSFFTSYRSYLRSQLSDKEVQRLITEERVKAELIDSIKADVAEGEYLFPLNSLMERYNERRGQLGLPRQDHRTRIKEFILKTFQGDLEERGEERQHKNLVFKDGINALVKEAKEKRKFDSDMQAIVAAAKVIREDIFNHGGFSFSGQFPASCQNDSLPASLKALMSMILHGTSLKNQSDQESQASLTAGQILYFNAKKTSKPNGRAGTISRHSLQREPPLPIFLSFLLHKEFRSKKLIHILHDIGIAVGYKRVVQLEKHIASSLCEQFEKDGAVVPLSLKKETFVVSAIDNIDWNPTSNLSTDSFHGTSISMHQQPTGSSVDQPGFKLSDQGYKIELPEAFTAIDPIDSPNIKINAPARRVTYPYFNFEAESRKEKQWLEQSQLILTKPTIAETDMISWAGYFSENDLSPLVEPSLTGILPLFEEKSASLPMLKHGLKVITSTVQKLNLNQIPIVAADQPLYALLKSIQWKYEIYNEQRVVIMLGGLHTEMCAWSVLGKLLDHSGWVDALTEAEVTTPGRAQAIVHASHLKRTRYMHEISAVVFSKLKNQAFVESGTDCDFEEWSAQQCTESPTFFFWDLILRIQKTIFMYVRAIRERNFNLYISCLEKLAPLFFALDATNYSRWLPIHIRDLKSLPSTILSEFLKGNFTVTKTKRKFSSIAVDQSHEMTNKQIKGNGGAIGLLTSREKLTQWLVVTPELSRIIHEFGQFLPKWGSDEDDDDVLLQHHEHTQSFQKNFHENAKNLYSQILEFGNPFGIQDENLLTLTTQDACHSSVITALRNLERKGQEQYNSFVRDVLESGKKSIHDVISKNSFPLMSTPLKKITSSNRSSVKAIHLNSALFSQALAVLQQREVPLLRLFSFELHFFPPSISNHGNLNLPGNKQAIVYELLTPCHNAPDHVPDYDDKSAVLFDGGRLTQQFPPKQNMTFMEYADMLFKGVIALYLHSNKRIDIVFDNYLEGSLITATRQKKGTGIQRRVTDATKCPKNWKQFLRDTTNKEHLNKFLAEKLTAMACPPDRQVLVTFQEKVLSNCVTTMGNCDHEEADTRILLHLKHALSEGMERIKIVSNDTDIVIIALGIYHKLRADNQFDDIRIEFGMKENHRSMSLKGLADSLGEPRCQALPFFHLFTGSDTTSAFKGIGKKKAYQAFKSYAAVEPIFSDFHFNAFQDISEEDSKFQVIQRLVILMYSRTSTLATVNEARMEMFFQGSQNIEQIPPTCNSLLMHTKRVIYQCGVWSRCLLAQQNLPSPQNFGWKQLNNQVIKWEPLWMTQNEASKEIREFVKCSCKSAVCSRCKCKAANLKCTLLCSCKCEDKVANN